MVDTIEQRLHDIDDAIALGRNQYLAAYFVGDTWDACPYAHAVDLLLDERNRIEREEP